MSSRSALGIAGQVWKAIRELNPQTVSRDAGRRLLIGVVGSEEEMDALTSWLTQGEELSDSATTIQRFDLQTIRQETNPAKRCDIVICAGACSPDALGVRDYRVHTWSPSDPDQTADSVLDEDRLDSLHIPLARSLKVFRKGVNIRIIRGTSFENAAFVASTAIGSAIPNPLAPLASVAEAAGDVVVLTANQVRMLFRLAAANRQPLGYKALAPQIASIIAAAFGWRALARELVGMVPFGAGLAAKSAVAYAGTWTMGEGLVLYFTTGRKMTREEARRRFAAIMGEARNVAAGLASRAVRKVRSTTGRV